MSARDSTECTVVIEADKAGGARHLCGTHTCSERCVMTVCQLDPREEAFRIPSHHDGRSLFLRYLPRLDEGERIVLYVHGAFSSGLAIAHRFDGRSWRDELC